MSQIIIGSARHDEYGKYVGGKAGDQTGSEVDTQAYYNHKKGWYVYRCVNEIYRKQIAEKMYKACINDNIGYSQSDRYSLSKYGIDTDIPCNTDCSELIRVIVKEVTGIDIGICTTANIGDKLVKTKLFVKLGKVGVQVSSSKLFAGDILCTCTKGHVVAVTKGVTDETTTGTGEAPKPVIKYGVRGEEVAKLQQVLNQMFGLSLDVDGICGNHTTDAIKLYQRHYGLEVDGKYGPVSYNKMKEVLKNV